MAKKKTLDEIAQDYIDSDGDPQVIENSDYTAEEVIEALQDILAKQNESADDDADTLDQDEEEVAEEQPKASTGGYRAPEESASASATFNKNADFGSVVGKLIYTAGSTAVWALTGLAKVASTVLPQVVKKGAPIVGQTAGVASGIFSNVVFQHDANGKVEKKFGLPVPQTWAKWVGGAAIAFYAVPVAWYATTTENIVVYTGSSDTKIEVEPGETYRFSGCILRGVESLNVNDRENLVRLQDAIDNAEDHKRGCNSKTQREFEINKSWLFPIVIDPEDEQFKSVQGTAVCSMKGYSWSIRIPYVNRYISRTQVHGIITCKQPSAIMTKSISSDAAVLTDQYNNFANLENADTPSSVDVSFNGKRVSNALNLG